jgi:spectinomycin phosphotransferase
VAPVPRGDGEPVARLGARFAVAVYPFIDARSFRWGEFISAERRLRVLDLLVAVHTAPAAARQHAMVDDFTIPHRDELAAACGPGSDAPGSGPCARPLAVLLRQHAAPLQRLLARYDEMVRQVRAVPSRVVLTHGEPHPGNTMLTADGRWLLIDWDTVLVAPPERDLWGLDPGDGTVLDAYARATGTVPWPPLLDLYRVRWDIADIAADVSRFRQPHAGTAEDDETWELLSSLIRRVSAGPAPG